MHRRGELAIECEENEQRFPVGTEDAASSVGVLDSGFTIFGDEER